MPNAENGNLNFMGSIVLQDRTIPNQQLLKTVVSLLQVNCRTILWLEFETPVTYTLRSKL